MVGWASTTQFLTFSKQKSYMDIGDRTSACIISIGTGEPTPVQNLTARNSWWRFWDRLTIINVFQNALALATDIKNDHDAFKEIAGLSSNWSYFRFNCGGGLADIPLDQASQLPTNENLTRAYLAKPQTQATIQDAVRAMAYPGR